MKDKEKAMLEWCLRLTYSGMTLDMVRYWMLKKHQELLARDLDRDRDLPVEVSAEKRPDEDRPL
jgi:hypothetical protein